MAIYTDLNAISPTKKELLTDVEVIYQSIFNILNTRPGERLFEPEFGVYLEDQLFELVDDISALSLLRIITQAVLRWENRVKVDYSRTKVVADVDNGRFDLTLVFQIVGMGEEVFSYNGSFSN